MAQTNFTPILTYKSDTATSVPSASNLTNSTNGAELAVNTADKRLFTKDSGGNVVEVGTNPSSMTLPNGSANGVAYLNGSKVLTSGSALTFDGSGTLNVINGGGTGFSTQDAASNFSIMRLGTDTANGYAFFQSGKSGTGTTLPFSWRQDSSELMRLTSTGLGIGTSSPNAKLDVFGGNMAVLSNTAATAATASTYALWVGNSATRDMTLGSDATYAYIQSWSGKPLYLNSQGNNVLFGSGNVGIGTSSPTGKLHVAGAIYANDATSTSVFTNSGGAAVIGTTTNHPVGLWTNGTLRATLDTSGNLGLGVTPSASNLPTIQSQYGIFTGDAETNIAQNAYYNSGWKYTTTAGASLYFQDNGAHNWQIAASGTAGNAITFTQAMTLTAAGDLGLGTTSPATYGSRTNLYVAGTLGGALILGEAAKTFQAVVLGDYNNGQMDVGTATNHPMRFITNNTERARIDSSGRWLVGTTSAIGAGFVGIKFDGLTYNGIQLQTTYATIGSGFVYFVNSAGTTIGYINQNATNTVAYNTSSDYRLKEDIQPMTGALAFVRKQRPVTYKWKADGSEGSGYIAHWMQEDGAGQCVTGEKDAVDKDGKPQYQGIDTSFMVGPLNAALNELADIVDAQAAIILELKARLDAANL